MGPASRNVALPERGTVVTEPAQAGRPNRIRVWTRRQVSGVPRNRDVQPGASPSSAEPSRQWGVERCHDTGKECPSRTRRDAGCADLKEGREKALDRGGAHKSTSRCRAATESGSAISHRRARVDPPASCAFAEAVLSSMSTKTVVAPSPASLAATAAPIPLAAPVTIATRPSNRLTHPSP